ncbi:TBC1 domain family member 17-like [Chlorella sorokiniana]|uniref:TBC1 domain family member 17-like n=1 Tax=Chlorella sorokiniana TaxID=3076 RepID=A0A2P6TX17_CHLSO|nr:TBC1 domain family member 17-like [Chlorella sorokiniana]|eukprot:PRW58614.1 TBC1 domain family member 17-like [Chlorella sorokiniana]
MEGPVLREGMLCTDQEVLPGGLSREGSMCERPRPGLAIALGAAVRDDWVGGRGAGGPPSFPLREASFNEKEEGEEQEAPPAELEDEYEGVCAGGGSSEEYSDVEDAGSHNTEVVYVKEGVCMFPSPKQRIMGRLSLIKQYRCLFLCWLPYAAGASPLEDSFSTGGTNGSSNGAAAAGGDAHGGGVESAKDRTMYAVHPIPLSDVRAISKHTPPLGQHRITITLASGVSLPSLHFQTGGVKAFLSCLRQHAPLVRSADDPNTWLVNDTGDPLQRSLCSLELTDVLIGGPPTGASSTFPPFAGPLAAGRWQAAEGEAGLRAQLGELIDRFQQLTQTAKDTASSLFAGSVLLGTAGAPEACLNNGLAPASNHTAGLAAAAEGSLGLEERRRSSLEASTSLGVFELIEGSAAEAAGSSPAWTRARPPPLTLAELNTFFDAEGRLTNPTAFRQRVHDGGVEPEARPEAWKLLLGVHAPGATRVERAAAAAERRRRYQAMRAQWRAMDGEQMAHCSKWRERCTRIDKDVRRTDRSHRFYARERGQAGTMLRNILLTYERFNQDLGYVQGMSDLASPLLYVMRGAVPTAGQLSNDEALGVEAEAFWAFKALMDRMEANFSSDSRAMTAQLLALRSLVQLLDPPLYAHLEARECLSFFFCYRWLLIWMKREFAFEEVLRLWEALWAGVPGLHLYLCVAVLEHHRRQILSSDWAFDDMLRFCVELSGKLKLEPLLRDAELLASYAGPAESAKGAAPDPSPLLAAAHDAGTAPSQQAMSAPAVEVTPAAAAPAPASDGAAAADAEKASAEVAQAVAKAASKHSSPTSSSSSDSDKAKAAAAAPAAAAAEEEVQQPTPAAAETAALQQDIGAAAEKLQQQEAPAAPAEEAPAAAEEAAPAPAAEEAAEEEKAAEPAAGAAAAQPAKQPSKQASRSGSKKKKGKGGRK